MALSKQNVAFVLEHQNDTWQELSQYLARCQAALGRAPARTEVIGGDFIELRFGSWGKRSPASASGAAAASPHRRSKTAALPRRI
ncbi:MAG: hypothetical protein V8T01_07545 [Oscillospiraceae bacterium]